MKNIVRLAIALFTITLATAATEKYSTFIIPFHQSKSGERVIIEIPSLPVSSYIKFPQPGAYILNKPEVLKRELERTGEYQVISTSVISLSLIIGFWSIIGLVVLIRHIRPVYKK
jgi:hypothetical protein